ncbi:hypothetical protein WJX79_008817, partial [Trebouxia sp. C0005]
MQTIRISGHTAYRVSQQFASHRPLTPQQGTTPGITPISKAIALLQHRSSTTPNASQGRTQRTAELSARKAELATLLNQVKTMESGLYIPKGGSTTPRLKAAKVPGHAGSHTTPPGASDNVALKRKRSMQDSVQHLRRLASEKSAQLGQLTTSNLSAVHTKGGQAGVSQRLASQLRHAATMESSSPDSFSSHSPLDTPAGDVRQRLLFDCHESRFGESAEPDPLSFGSPQRAEHAQQAEQHDLGAINSSFQAFSLQSSLSSPRLLHQSSAPSSGLATPQPLERNHSTGLQLQRSGGDSDQGEDRDSLGASPMRQALD